MQYPGLGSDRLLNDFSYANQLSDLSERVDASELKLSLKAFFEKLSLGVPLEFIIGESFFFDSYFYCSEKTLIPRSESEVLVEKVLEMGGDKTGLELLEIGTGTGCLAITVLRHLSGGAHHMTVTDISEDVIDLAKKNFYRHQYSMAKHEVDFSIGDRFSCLPLKQFDIIFSNPPYIPRGHRDRVHPKVLEFEPESALFVPAESPMLWFREFFEGIKNHLAPGGEFIVELSEFLIEEVYTEMEAFLPELKCAIVDDLTGRKRFIKGSLSG